MALTTHEKIRVESGFQSRFLKDSFITNPNGTTTFYVQSDDYVKFVPEFGTGSTVAGVSDVQVWCGLSGINGVSRMGVVSIDIDSGPVTLSKAPDSGCSLTINYSSSPITSLDVENVRLQAESMVNQRLSLCYNLPIAPSPSVLTSLATRLASALLLIRNYGTGSRDTSGDGYALYEQIVGNNTEAEGSRTGELNMICSNNYQLVDDSGSIIDRNDDELINAGSSFTTGGRTGGRLFDITEENFRFKVPQVDANREQRGSGVYGL